MLSLFQNVAAVSQFGIFEAFRNPCYKTNNRQNDVKVNYALELKLVQPQVLTLGIVNVEMP